MAHDVNHTCVVCMEFCHINAVSHQEKELKA